LGIKVGVARICFDSATLFCCRVIDEEDEGFAGTQRVEVEILAIERVGSRSQTRLSSGVKFDGFCFNSAFLVSIVHC